MSRTFKILLFSSVSLLVWACTAPFLAEYLIIEKPLAKADVIFILGGSSTYIERTQKAAEVFSDQIAAEIILTDDGEKAGWSRGEERNPPYVDLAQQELIRLGVPQEKIKTLKPDVSGTVYEAQALVKVAKAKNLKSILIVTSAYHSRRSLWIFETQFNENNMETEIGIEHASTGQQTPTPYTWWLRPYGWRAVAGEYVKILYYWMSY